MSIKSFRLLTEYHSFLRRNFPKLDKEISSRVSVSLRSIIHSYFVKPLNLIISGKDGLFPSPYGVSFILTVLNHFDSSFDLSFRLLTEYHSFLQEIWRIHKGGKSKIRFRLLTEYHSFLRKHKSYFNKGTN